MDEIGERRDEEITLIFKESRICTQITFCTIQHLLCLEGVVSTFRAFSHFYQGLQLMVPRNWCVPFNLIHCVSQALWKTLLPVFHITIALESVYFRVFISLV